MGMEGTTVISSLACARFKQIRSCTSAAQSASELVEQLVLHDMPFSMHATHALQKDVTQCDCCSPQHRCTQVKWRCQGLRRRPCLVCADFAKLLDCKTQPMIACNRSTLSLNDACFKSATLRKEHSLTSDLGHFAG